MADLLADFITLFRGRTDCYGSWEGGCIKEPISVDTYRNHLGDGPHVGIYPVFNLDGVAHTFWGCTDIDYDDHAEAKRLQDAFAAVDITAWTERTRKGWHIWVFANSATPAEDMRRMFLACHQVAKSVPKEVNPKQTVLRDGQVGNYVRLPYPNGNAATERYVSAHGSRLAIEEFVTEAMQHRCTPARVAELATYYTPPPPPPVVVAAPSHDMTSATRQLTALGKVVFRHGPTANGDRSTALACLAHQCQKSGLAISDALAIMEDADWRWGKFMQRGEQGKHELAKLVARAYGNMPST